MSFQLLFFQFLGVGMIIVGHFVLMWKCLMRSSEGKCFPSQTVFITTWLLVTLSKLVWRGTTCKYCMFEQEQTMTLVSYFIHREYVKMLFCDYCTDTTTSSSNCAMIPVTSNICQLTWTITEQILWKIIICIPSQLWKFCTLNIFSFYDIWKS